MAWFRRKTKAKMYGNIAKAAVFSAIGWMAVRSKMAQRQITKWRKS